MSIGLAYVFADKEKRKTSVSSLMAGEFSNGSAHLATMSFKYRF
jgi:long-subunit fatty acid transport protein